MIGLFKKTPEMEKIENLDYLQVTNLNKEYFERNGISLIRINNKNYVDSNRISLMLQNTIIEFNDKMSEFEGRLKLNGEGLSKRIKEFKELHINIINELELLKNNIIKSLQEKNLEIVKSLETIGEESINKTISELRKVVEEGMKENINTLLISEQTKIQGRIDVVLKKFEEKDAERMFNEKLDTFLDELKKKYADKNKPTDVKEKEIKKEVSNDVEDVDEVDEDE